MDNFSIHQKNPNAERGGNGCLCSDMKDRDCHGPYVVWDAVDMASPDNPYPVACKTCISHAIDKMESEPAIDYREPERKKPAKKKKENPGTDKGFVLEL